MAIVFSDSSTLVGVAPPPLKRAGILASLRAISGNPFELLPAVAYEQSLYRHPTLTGSMLMVNDPEGVKRVLLDNVANYPKNEIEIQFFSAMFGEGLLSAGPSKWRAHRKVMAPSFGGKTVTGYAPIMADAAQQFAALWERQADGRVVDIAAEMKDLTLTIICRTMFSSDAEELKALAGPALEFTQSALKFGLLDVLPLISPYRIRRKTAAIHRRFSGMDAAIYRLIGAREQSLTEAPKDLLSRLIAAKDADDGSGLSPAEVRDEVITIFMAGYETSAVTMTWVWYLLAQHPHVAARLREELDAVLGGRTPTADDVPKLTYTRMIIEETMRLYPPAPGISVRKALEADEICGEKIPAGTQIIVAPWVLHRHRKLWSDPLKFDPEHFSPQQSAQRTRFAYLPFGGGPRVCIGATLALTEATLILAVLGRRFSLQLAAGQNIKLQTRITLRPQNGLKMRLWPALAA